MSDSTMWVVFGAIGVTFLGIVVYLIFMVFLPEWVGITGKVALDAEKSHEGGKIDENRFWTMLGQVPTRTQDSESSSSDNHDTSKD